MTALSFGRRNERAPVSLGSVAKGKPCTADLGPSPLQGLGRTLDLKGNEAKGTGPQSDEMLELYQHGPRHKSVWLLVLHSDGAGKRNSSEPTTQNMLEAFN